MFILVVIGTHSFLQNVIAGQCISVVGVIRFIHGFSFDWVLTLKLIGTNTG
jgi:hypothetical protein